MKKLILFTALIFLFQNSVKSQNQVIIPDPNFVAWLQIHNPTAMTGNLMDTTDASLLSPSTGMQVVIDGNQLGLSSMDITGIKYFKSLDYLFYGNFPLGGPPQTLPELPFTVTNLDISNANITYVTNIPASCGHLTAVGNLFSTLPAIPVSSLLDMNLNGNPNLTSLPILSASTQTLNISNTPLLTSIPNIPVTLKYLTADSSGLTSLPSFSGNPWFVELQCKYSQLTSLPVFPYSTATVNVEGCPIASVASPLPSNLQYFNCGSCNLSALPTLPLGIQYLDVSNCQIECFPSFPNISYIDITGNPFYCVPNHIPAMSPNVLAVPLCNPNTSNCNGYQGVKGVVYNDMNSNCNLDTTDPVINHVALKIYDNFGNLLLQTETMQQGNYFIPQAHGSYKIVMDTLNKPYTVACNYPGNDSAYVLNNLNEEATINFGVKCRQGVDVGAQSVTTHSIVFPGQNHELRIAAGDISQIFSSLCSANTGGSVTVSVNGPVTYVSPTSSALTPTVSGNIFTYYVSNFSTLNFQTAFGMILHVSNSATTSDTIKVTVNVASAVSDYNLSNNTLLFNYRVLNSYDPNYKQTSPENVSVGYNNWFTYTIHFQNTGNAAAINIELKDTLSSYLNLSTFEVLNASHAYTYSLKGRALSVYYKNIFLADSLSDPDGSQGFVQYRIKPKTNWPSQNIIYNKAFIYFDFNTPIITNTTENKQLQSVGIKSLSSQNADFDIFPNPAFDNIDVKVTNTFTKSYQLEVIDFTGKQVYKSNTLYPYKNTLQKTLSVQEIGLTKGMYLINLIGDNGTLSKKLIID